MFGVRLDRFDDEVEFIGAIDLARYAVGHSGPDELGFCKVMNPINTLRIEVLHQKHRTRRVLRPREEEEMIGAEIKHGWKQERRARKLSAHWQRRCGVRPADSSAGVSHSAAPDRCRNLGNYSSGVLEFLLALRKLSPPSRKISEFSTSRSAMAVAMVVLNKMLPQSENGVFVVMIVERL